ncbi:MAG: hypothetical protein AB7I50_15150 [Vicinamibacterales bacterium]
MDAEMGFTNHATDLYLSRHIAGITVVGATDVSRDFPSSTTWVSSFGLCVIFQNHPPEANRQLALQFVRRIEMAFSEYSLAVKCLEDLIGDGPGRWSPYYRTLYHFEAAIAQLYLAYDNMRKRLGQNGFESGDGSVLDRLNKVFNASKHEPASSEQAVWLTNEGVSANESTVAFVELEALLRKYGRLADTITNQRPNDTDA